jgi:ligand-binding SRPBCC domain-containing protein
VPTVEYVCDLDAPLERVWAFYDDIASLFKLTPPENHARLEGEPAPMRVGVVYHLIVKRFGVPIHWDAEIVAYDPPRLFRDRQVDGKGPFHSWTHTHTFEALPNARTRMIDHVEYEAPFGPFGKIANLLFIRRELDAMFAYRQKITRENVEKQK